MPAQTSAGPIALWRSQSGQATASADRCPHRGMRLSHGFVRGEALSCIYHGWSYARSGNCLRIPAHPNLTPPETIRVETFPVEETDGILWVAVGKPAAEPPRLEGLAPLRSLTAHAGIAAVEAAAGARADTRGLVEYGNGTRTIRLLLVPQQADRTLIHVLLDDGGSPSQRIAASRAAETARRAAEDLEAKGGAS